MKQLKQKNKITKEDAKEVVMNATDIDALTKDESENTNAKQSKKYLAKLNIALEQLSANPIYLKPGPEGLDKYSPKMKVMLENILKSEGLVFIYSDFRIEGLNIYENIRSK